MNKKKIVILSVIIVLSLCCLGIALNAIIDTRPQRYCEMQDVILTEEEIPEGSIIDYRKIPATDGPKDSGLLDFSLHGDPFYYEIIRYSRNRFAMEEFEETAAITIQYGKAEGSQHWEKPSEVEVNSEYITMYDYGCAVDLGYYQCRVIATYDEYFIYLRSGISDYGITYETFNELLEKIDEKMSTCYTP